MLHSFAGYPTDGFGPFAAFLILRSSPPDRNVHKSLPVRVRLYAESGRQGAVCGVFVRWFVFCDGQSRHIFHHCFSAHCRRQNPTGSHMGPFLAVRVGDSQDTELIRHTPESHHNVSQRSHLKETLQGSGLRCRVLGHFEDRRCQPTIRCFRI